MDPRALGRLYFLRYKMFHRTLNVYALCVIKVVGGSVTALGHYRDPRPRVVDSGTPLRKDKRVALDKDGATDKQCLGEGIYRGRSTVSLFSDYPSTASLSLGTLHDWMTMLMLRRS